ncbi:MAG TPA: ubiquinol-cytochrome c reductase iron-sulfur subunit [Pyrinomonadaceae bacterium]|nr:ubiquinol-cytochrome c reductase iron-sulfur subunit [Pyrinomonadaceae bacterium]
MRSKRSGLADAPTPERKPESPDESIKAGKTNLTRRKLISRIGLGATILGISGQAYAFLRSLVPNVLYENPQRFKVGTIDQFGEGAKFIDDKRVFIFREKNTFHCISATCTHLGCTVKMNRLNQSKTVSVRGRQINEQVEFACPCHGSKYYGDGTNYSGPAPKPLAHYKLEVSPDDGQLIVDTSQTVPQDFRLTV